MKYLNILVIALILVLAAAVSAQQEPEKSKANEKAQEVKKPDSHGFLFQYWPESRHHRRSVRTIPFVDVTDIELIIAETVKENNELCFPDSLPGIEVITKVNNPNQDILIYNYTVSGGRIVGTGERVVWILSGVKPGNYTITAGVDEGCGFCGRTVTKTVTIK